MQSILMLPGLPTSLLLPAAPAGAAGEQAQPATYQPVPARLPAAEAPPLPVAAAETSGETLGQDGGKGDGPPAGPAAADAGREAPDSGLPPDRERVEAQLRALGATLLFEKV